MKINSKILVIQIATFALLSCDNDKKLNEIKIPEVPVIELAGADLETSTAFATNLEGIQDIDIRPQVSGYLKKIAIDEGQKVNKGDLLFMIEDDSFNAALNNANASFSKETAIVEKASIELERVKNLQKANIISATRVANAKADYDAALATLEEAKYKKNEAQVKRDFTRIYAPFSGYSGRIKHKVGSLVDGKMVTPLVALSKIDTIYAYFSMSEDDFINFKNNYTGNSIEEKIKNVPPIDLRLSGSNTYEQKGKVDMVNGSFDRSTGSITLRASFPNTSGLLRSGNTGTILLHQKLENAIAVPQSATFEMQDKILLYKVSESNYLEQISIKVSKLDNQKYLLIDGVKEGDIIVEKGIERLQDSLKIIPKFQDRQ